MSRSVWLSVCLVGLFSYQAQAQVIHGHPQKTAYASPSEWPFLSAQCHWAPADASLTPLTPTLGHTHVELTVPAYAETTLAPFTVPFQIQLFHLAGKVVRIDTKLVSSLTWDNGVSLPLVGDPNGLKVYTGHLTFNPALSNPAADPISSGQATWEFVPVHGWWEAGVHAITVFDNGAATDAGLAIPLFSMINPTAPEEVLRFRVASTCFANSPNDVRAMDTSVSEILDQYLPILAPIAATWQGTGSAYNYGLPANVLEDGTYQQRLDMNLHMGIPGTVLDESHEQGAFAAILRPITIDPAVMPAGAHKLALIWDQKTGAGGNGFVPNQEQTSLLVFGFTIGSSGPSVDCVVGPWVLVSTTTSTSPIMTMGTLQSKTDSLNNLYQRTILTPPANGGAACPVN